MCSYSSLQAPRSMGKLGINKGGRDEGGAGGCTHLPKIFCQLRCASRLVRVCLNSAPGFLMVSVLTWCCFLHACCWLRYCSVVKHDVSQLAKEMTMEGTCLKRVNQASWARSREKRVTSALSCVGKGLWKDEYLPARDNGKDPECRSSCRTPRPMCRYLHLGY